jgi:hypothetical protein
MSKLLRLVAFSLFLMLVSPQPAPSQSPYILADRLGIAHISSSTDTISTQRYQQALILGAGWNRWPIYWDRVEPIRGAWDWTAIDRQVADDLRFGFEIDAILMGVPQDRQAGNSIQGLHAPIFADGSDQPMAGKAINPENGWAVFVAQVVNRYRPSGLLAQTGAIPRGAGISVWEIWNEPDFQLFWKAGANDYARLLKVSSIIIKLIDPQATVVFGGLLYPTNDNFFAQVLEIISRDPMRHEHRWFMDVVGIHSYADPWRSGWLAIFTRQTMRYYSIDRPIWMTETGVPVWNDYPGPIWETNIPNYATLEQQAWYLIQSASMAWTEGVEKVFLHQLYDDCGDQPAGTNFVPHNGNLCVGGGLCHGDAHGIYRNPSTAICFSHHPQAGTPRPLGQAFRLLAEIFGVEPFQPAETRRTYNSQFAVIPFDRPATNERVIVMWNRGGDINTVDVTATGGAGRLISLQSNNVIYPNEDGVYQITLPPALPQGTRSGADIGGWAIGGMPYILIEQRNSQEAPEFERTPTPIPQPTVRPTIDPALDRLPPTGRVLPLAEYSPSSFEVRWEGYDNSGVDSYIVWVRVDGGDWVSWQTTEATSAIYHGSAGQRIEFALWVLDLAGNWSENITLQPQAITTISQ